MGLSAIEGLPMSTRAGEIDAGILLHLMKADRMDPAAVELLLDKHSGLLGISGVICEDPVEASGRRTCGTVRRPCHNWPEIAHTKRRPSGPRLHTHTECGNDSAGLSAQEANTLRVSRPRRLCRGRHLLAGRRP